MLNVNLCFLVKLGNNLAVEINFLLDMRFSKFSLKYYSSFSKKQHPIPGVLPSDIFTILFERYHWPKRGFGNVFHQMVCSVEYMKHFSASDID